MELKKSLSIKTAIILTLILSLSAIGYSYFIYKRQMRNINNLIENQKEYLIEHLEKSEKRNLAQAKKSLLNEIKSFSIAVEENLFNLDMENMKIVVKNFMEIQPFVKGIEIFDSLGEKNFLTAYRDKNNQIKLDKKIPQNIKKFKFLKYILTYPDEKIGEIKIYYDFNSIIKKIDLQKKEELEKLHQLQNILRKNTKENLVSTILVFIAIILIIDVFIFFLMIRFVSHPINELKHSLNSFFKFLNNPKEKIKKVSYKSEDEIGRMIEEVNKNIEVSERLHREISNLIETVDKNVLMVNLDENGKIKNVSKAFSKLTYYSKEELLNKNFEFLFSEDFDKKIIKKMWRVLKTQYIFRRIFTFKTKRGEKIYLRAIITPKCFSKDACGYDVLLFNITDKKKVEELLETLEEKVEERTRELSNAKKEIELIFRRLNDSIKYASFIQKGILPKNELFKEAFEDYFIIYEPKDTVGGDIYQLIKINENEYILMVIDCTSHGVPGAFVTMLVKAISEQIILNLKEKTLLKNPAAILNFFNLAIKQILNQYENSETKSNVGFDGGIIYYNKKDNQIIFSGANVSLFYLEDEELKTIKGDRTSIGYKKSKENYPFKESVIPLKKEMKFYITTDGFIDQNGGEKHMPFGKKRFKNLIEKYHNLPFETQRKKFLEEFKKWKNGEEQTDDITLIGFKV